MVRLSNPDINPEFFSAEFRSGLAEFLKIHIDKKHVCGARQRFCRGNRQ